jgi:hypothetical protein
VLNRCLYENIINATLYKTFSFLTDEYLTHDEVKSEAKQMVNTYSSDLGDDCVYEFSMVSSSSLYKDKKKGL